MGSESAHRFWLALIGIACCAIAATAWEFIALGWHPAREEHAAFGSYHLWRIAACALASVLLVSMLERIRVHRAVTAVSTHGIALVVILLSLVASAALVAVFLASPANFHAFAGEDHAVEWVSALLLFAGSALFISSAAKNRGRLSRFDVLVCLGLAGAYFVVAMEEISWMQRVFGYDTPEAIAERNWQGEFNLHNFQTDIAELVYYSATGAFLIVLPLLAETLPSWKPFKWFKAFIPGRTTAAVSAPMLLFTYGQWNLLLFQLVCFAGFFALVVYARISVSRLDKFLFYVLAAVVAFGEAAFLALGHRMLDVPDASECKELFIALGLAWFATEFWLANGNIRR